MLNATTISKLVKPFAKRRARKRVERAGGAVRGIAMTVAPYAPGLARAIESLAPPKRKRVAARVGAGAVLGTGVALGGAAVYFLEPKGGRERRKRIRRLVK